MIALALVAIVLNLTFFWAIAIALIGMDRDKRTNQAVVGATVLIVAFSINLLAFGLMLPTLLQECPT